MSIHPQRRPVLVQGMLVASETSQDVVTISVELDGGGEETGGLALATLVTVAARRLGGSLVGVVTSPVEGVGRVASEAYEAIDIHEGGFSRAFMNTSRIVPDSGDLSHNRWHSPACKRD